jgi:hypothetical protein
MNQRASRDQVRFHEINPEWTSQQDGPSTVAAAAEPAFQNRAGHQRQ